jgi:hypothetical protein
MKYKSIPFIAKACFTTPILAIGSLLLSPISIAITPEKALSEYIWQGFQGGPEHKGHIPVSIIVDNSPTAVSNWTMEAILSNPINSGSTYAF